MVACVYIKDGNMCLYNEDMRFTDIGGFAYELGKPLLDFIWYERDRFDDGLNIIAGAYDNEFAHDVLKDPDYIAEVKKEMELFQTKEIYVYFYYYNLMDFAYKFIESPREAVARLAQKFPRAQEKLRWVVDFEYPSSDSPFVQVAHFADKEKRLYRAMKDAVAVMYDHFCGFQQFIIHEIEVFIHYRKEIKVPNGRTLDYLGILDEYRKFEFGEDGYFLESPFRTFFGNTANGEVAQLYSINHIEDLFRFEFIKMIEHEIFIKLCKNCNRFFIPERRVDAEYCNRIFGDTGRRCNEIGAMLRYEKKVAENPVLEAHKKAYRRFNSRTRNKKMTQSEFMTWSDEATRKRDECLAGTLPFDEFVDWLEQGRVRKSKGKGGE